MNEAKKTSGMSVGKIAVALLIAALSGGLIYYWVKNYNLTRQMDEQYENAGQLTMEIEHVERQLDAFKADLQLRDLSLEEKDELLSENETALKQQEARIADLLSRNKISQEEAAHLRGKVDQLNYYLKQYQAQVDTLKQGIVLRDGRIASMDSVTDSLRMSLHEKEMEKIGLDIKLAAAKRLSAHPFYFYRGSSGGAEASESAFRNGQLDELKICFDIAENVSVDWGPKDVYIQIFDPNTKLVKNERSNWFYENGGENMEYSAKSTFNYRGEPTTICMPFARPVDYDYPPGNYSVVAYSGGFQIGSGFFKVK
jgi:hypothetical protein